MLGIHLSLHPRLSPPPFFFLPHPPFRQKLVKFSGMAEDWMKSIRTQHLLSSLWTLRQEGLDHPNMNHTPAKWAWGAFPVGHLHYLVSEGVYAAPLLATRNSFFRTEKPNQMYRALGVGYKNVFRHLKKKNQCIYLTSFRVSKAHFNFLICLFCSILIG